MARKDKPETQGKTIKASDEQRSAPKPPKVAPGQVYRDWAAI
ncbi:hypothetical protein [Anianabacter salinae]|nr:hypothetical protein [Anianabacter salinae]